VLKMRLSHWLFLLVMVFPVSRVAAETCLECHQKITPGLVSDWETSAHSKNGVDCVACHQNEHISDADAVKAKVPTPEVCASCHEAQMKQFKSGKHAAAWAAMNAMPTAHWQPMALMEGLKGCGGCHQIGLKSQEDIKKLKNEGMGFGRASCDVCHSRHSFSVQEARAPQTCRTCHMGIDHPQWEMFESSKHGVRYLLKQNKVLPETAAAPSCQTCHMQEGNHEVRTAWGFLAVRLPMPQDQQWAADRATILQGLGVLDPAGKPTARLDVVKAANVARLTQEDWQQDRDKMLKTCGQCHSAPFAQRELAKGDDMIKAADHLMAEGIRVVAALYQDGILKKPQNYPYAFPDLLTFHDAPTPVEQTLFLMFLKHRMRTFQGSFHNNPDYALWYGWSEMQTNLISIRAMAAEMRDKAEPVKAGPVKTKKR
jgi:hydroxylamine dehydrogenase